MSFRIVDGDLDPALVWEAVRDPMCGVHLPESRSVTDRRDGQLLHFCSAKCRDEFLRTG